MNICLECKMQNISIACRKISAKFAVKATGASKIVYFH